MKSFIVIVKEITQESERSDADVDATQDPKPPAPEEPTQEGRDEQDAEEQVTLAPPVRRKRKRRTRS
ncbi:hypothetical protein F442_21440 [Phytophthora nicotianae P10297]|uniref:Uncharacterized protein n=1 Tax=Phytophthora nicotianae P10297 TaxID=1317064 RepID=W2Y3U3_PHYNI|nr:hypothetical protein F442_21440 [Phytophthora nicotianae P10297]